MSALLEIKDLRGGYAAGADILHGIDFSIEKGRTVGIIGLNGSGKSTFGKAIMNMIPHRSGEILYNGEPVAGLSASELSRRGIAIMMQGGQVFRTMSVWENLQLAFGGSYGDEHFAETLTGIIPLLRSPRRELQHRMADRLSGGERHQLALAMTLARRPQLAVLDEPSAGLSPKTVSRMYDEILSEIKKMCDISFVIIEQNISKAVAFCDECLLLSQGRIACDIRSKDLSEIEKIMFNKNK